jgi:hypothetical protein
VAIASRFNSIPKNPTARDKVYAIRRVTPAICTINAAAMQIETVITQGCFCFSTI